MQKLLSAQGLKPKIMHVHESVAEVRASARKVGDAAESQATLNIALTAVCVTALIVAALLVHGARTGVVPGGR